MLNLLVSQSVGPRILSLSHAGGDNLLAELPDAVLECPGSGKLHLYGGHRLWHAPEEPSRTYLPDHFPVEVTAVEDGCRLTQDVESRTGLQKSMEIHLVGNAVGLRLSVACILSANPREFSRIKAQIRAD